MTKAFLREIANRTILGDGAMGTQLYSKGIYINQCYELLNIENPGLIREVHEAYIAAGAEIIETNTFGANPSRLANFKLEARTAEINQKAVQIAQQACGNKDIWIAGSLGPLAENTLPFGRLTEEETQSIYEEQIAALIQAGVDLLFLETFTHLPQLKAACLVAKKLNPEIPVVGLITVNDQKSSALGETLETICESFENLPLDIVGFNCSSGPAAILDILEDQQFQCSKPLAAFPNAGHPRNLYGRTMYLATPEYFGNFAKKLIHKGVKIIGGCCGTGPEHIRRTRDRLAGESAEVKSESIIQFELDSYQRVSPAEKSRLAARISEGKFVVSIEIDPPRGTDLRKVLSAAEVCAQQNVDAINIADGPRASARMDPMSLGQIFSQKFQIETIIHFCCRDRNLLALQNNLLGAHALGFRNILAITGDPLKLGDYPEATSVFDLDAIGLSKLIRNLNHGRDAAGHEIGGQTSFFQGVGCNPAALNFEMEMERLEKKIDAGAEFVMTQPVYDQKTFEKFLKSFQKFSVKIPILIGICPLASLRNAEFLDREVPGMQIPKSIMERMKNAEDPAAEGIKIAREALEEFRKSVQGTYLMPPFNRVEAALQVIEGLR